MVTLGDAPRGVDAEEVASTPASRSYYSISQAAELLGVSRVSIWRWVRAGRLSVVRLGHRTARIKREDLEGLPVHIGPSGYRSRTVPAGSADQLSGSDPALANGAEHFVQFYESDEFLLEAVSEFIGPALRGGNSAVVVATNAHLASLEDALTAQGFDLAAARATGQYVSLDAAETLSRFMVGAEPDPSRFEDVVGALIVAAGAGQRPVRVYGEMVALLAAAGNHRATIRLEELWNDLQHRHPFSLFCGYPMDRFGGEALAELLGDVCEEHSRVVPAESFSALVDQGDRLRAVAVLQQQAESLRAEIAERKRAEDQLLAALEAERVARAGAEAALRSRDLQAAKLARLVGQLLDLSRG